MDNLLRHLLQAAPAAPANDDVGELSGELSGAALQARFEQLLQAEQLRREFLANVSHDLRGPLTSVNGFIEELMAKDEQLPACERRGLYRVIHNNVQLLRRLMDDLFELSKLETKSIEPRCESFPLQYLIQDVVLSVEWRSPAHPIYMELPEQGGLPLAHADISMAERVLSNLLENAVRHTPPGTRITVEVGFDKPRLWVSVSDDGPGIGPEDLERIFERSFSKSTKLAKQPPSSGLGLAIVKKMLELHGCGITVQSVLGRGTTFRFELPANESATALNRSHNR